MVLLIPVGKRILLITMLEVWRGHNQQENIQAGILALHNVRQISFCCGTRVLPEIKRKQ